MTKKQFIIGGTEEERRTSAAAIAAYKATLDMGKKYRLTIEPYRRKRSTSQNGYYWMVVDMIAEESGEDKDDLHEGFRLKFCPHKTISVLGEDQLVQSTKDLNTLEFSAYMEKIAAWAAQFLNMTIPLPEDQGR